MRTTSPLNGELDTGGGVGAVNANYEQGLGGFQIHLLGRYG